MRFGMIGDNPIEKAVLARGTGTQATDKARAGAPA